MKSGFQSLFGSLGTVSDVAGESAVMAIPSSGALEAVKNVESFFEKNPALVNGAKKIINSDQTTKAILEDITKTVHSGKSDLFRILPDSLKKMVPELAKLDKSLLETSVGRNILAKLGGQVKFLSGGKASIAGNTTARFAGTTMAKIPLLGILISTAFELPEIIKAFKAGRGAEQVIKSAINVACTTAGAAMGAAFLMAFPPFGCIVGAALGGILGEKLGHCLGGIIPKKPMKKLASWGMANLCYS